MMKRIRSIEDDGLRDVFVALNPDRFDDVKDGDHIEIICTVRDGKLVVVYCDLCGDLD